MRNSAADVGVARHKERVVFQEGDQLLDVLAPGDEDRVRRRVGPGLTVTDHHLDGVVLEQSAASVTQLIQHHDVSQTSR